MAFLLCRKNIARGKPQQGDRYRRDGALALPIPPPSRYSLQRDTPGQALVEPKVEFENYSTPRSRHRKNLIMRRRFPYCGSLN
jgi:hypothetical protein